MMMMMMMMMMMILMIMRVIMVMIMISESINRLFTYVSTKEPIGSFKIRA